MSSTKALIAASLVLTALILIGVSSSSGTAFSGLTITGCGGICHVLALLLKYDAEIEATKTGKGSGTITMRSGGSGPPRI